MRVANALQWFVFCGWGGWHGAGRCKNRLGIFQEGGSLSSNVAKNNRSNVKDGSVQCFDWVLSSS